MSDAFLRHVRATLDEIETAGLAKRERLLAGPQGGRIRVASDAGERRMLNLCSNNYLGLADHPEVVAAAKGAMDEFGFGMASVRFICGAQTLHRELECAIARHLGKDDAIVFAACFDANGGVFEPLMGEEDAIISDSLNHASIIDGVRLAKARRYRFGNSDMNALEDSLKQADGDGARFKLIATDGVFSMDGYVAKLPDICALAERYGAMVLGRRLPCDRAPRRERPRHPGADGRGRQNRYRHRHVRQNPGRRHGRFRRRGATDRRPPAPARAALSLLEFPCAAGRRRSAQGAGDRDSVRRRSGAAAGARRDASVRGLEAAGFPTLPGVTPIVPVMLGEAQRAQDLSKALDQRGVYVAGFFFPVVPKGQARIRAQMSAALTAEDVDFAVDAFADAGRALGIV